MVGFINWRKGEDLYDIYSQSGYWSDAELNSAIDLIHQAGWIGGGFAVGAALLGGLALVGKKAPRWWIVIGALILIIPAVLVAKFCADLVTVYVGIDWY
ncbi:MAG: hypothetical protein LBG60_04140 [Bifidobacteriaceae bacterium]|nr:hypothetical protein [Bifidobacteriaceae bacterium]